ncbi:flagellar assembly protein FliW [Bacillus benzoevorans]|uniref:Flagellar assembly factor FliW n=1 Tax=Bacillus benzoevorans TaxID=1456 RepID=A0A7X0LYB5_9BACI|nr:flagellar assembly protein FliW [Bacillus benzoevorans]MBB6447284.1 flagellar assembly factor FliW [Bacillus benzoevorans]
MIIQTKFHGKQEIAAEDIIHFESGIPGFLHEKEFCILPMTDTPFYVMQSIQTTEVAFIIMEPFQIFPDYEFDLPDELLAGLNFRSDQDLAVFVILTVQEPFNKTTANLQAPIILNQANKKAKQYIINQSLYTTKHLIIQPSVEQGVK